MNKSNIIFIFNGLGNQMSQYAFFLASRTRLSNTRYVTWSNDHNGYELNRIFGIPAHSNPWWLFILRIILTRIKYFPIRFLKILFEKLRIGAIDENSQYTFDYRNTLPTDYKVTLWFGGWHNPQYFENIKDTLPDVFRFPIGRLNPFSKNILDKIHSSNSVAVHVRRGDYLNALNLQVFGNICTLSYYRRAIEYIHSKVNNPTYFVFSNDLEWVKEHINIPEAIFVNLNSGNDSWMDMFLMSQCQNIIIANSTFSWWGANLSKSSLIVCPDKFTNSPNSGEIYPKDWIRIKS